MNNFQAQGRAAYKRGAYREAIDHFDRAIGHAPSVQLLDNRAACSEKLGNLSAALKDAKRTINLHTEDATGYLRAGKLVMAMNKPGTALDIYTHGLKCIKHVGLGYEMLKKVHKEALDLVSPDKSRDPLTMLPPELAEGILAYLSFRQTMNACLVSPGWTRFIRSTPTLWAHLDLSRAKKTVRLSFISRAINIGRRKIRKASLSMLSDFDKSLAALVKHCPLEELILLDLGTLAGETVKSLQLAKHLKVFKMGEMTPMPADWQGPLLQALPEDLETLWIAPWADLSRARGWERLMELDVTATYGAIHVLLTAAQEMPRLRSLRIRGGHSFNGRRPQPMSRVPDLSACAELTNLDLHCWPTLMDRIVLPPNLVSLSLDIGPTASSRLYHVFLSWDTCVATLPNLKDLTLRSESVDVHEIIFMFLHGDPKGESKTETQLRSLSVTSATMSLVVATKLFASPALTELKALSLIETQDCDDDTVEHIVKTLPNLHTLDLTASKVTGVGVKHLAKAKCLERVVLNDCYKMDKDAVDWARAYLDVEVVYKMKQEVVGSRKVRY